MPTLPSARGSPRSDGQIYEMLGKMPIERPFQSTGKRLKTAMAVAGVDNQRVAEVAGVHIKTVSAWRSGTQEPSVENFEAIAPLLGSTRDYLKRGVGQPPSPLVLHAVVEADRIAEPESFSQQARAFVNRFLARLIEAGVTEDDERYARRVLLNPGNYGFGAGGNTPTPDDDRVLREVQGMAEGVRQILIVRGYDLPPAQ